MILSHFNEETVQGIFMYPEPEAVKKSPLFLCLKINMKAYAMQLNITYAQI